ncbi:hypothetical protein KC867_01385 [Candidatus Saccharibacteria bacterium]|nr:hypothetical protein [Candidatus Saccharibacteria bacterium]
MEYINPNKYNKQEDPDKIGESKTSKKKKKISKFPLSLTPEQIREDPIKSSYKKRSILDLVDISRNKDESDAEIATGAKNPKSRKRRRKNTSKVADGANINAGDSSNSAETLPESGDELEAQQSTAEVIDADNLTQAPENELDSTPESDSEYMGELIIDHSDERIDNPDYTEALAVTNDTEAGFVPSIETTAPTDVAPSLFADVLDNNIEDTAQMADINYPATASEYFAHHTTREPFNYELSSSAQTEDVKTYNQVASSRTLNEAVYRAEKRGLSKGVTTGLLFGWLIGRRGKASLEKQLDSMEKSHASQVESLQKELDVKSELSKQRLGIIEKTKQHVNDMAAEIKRRSAEIEQASREAFKPKFTPMIESNHETYSSMTSSTPESASPVFEVAELTGVVEKKSSPEPVLGSRVEQEDASEQAQTRKEVSAWHSYDVDASTGRLAKESSIEYGEAFQSELQQERLAHNVAVSHTASQVGSALFTSGGIGTSTNQTTNMSNDFAPDKSTATFDIGQVGQAVADVSKAVVDNMTSPNIWLVAGVVFLAMYLLGMFG